MSGTSDHPITVTANPNLVRVIWRGTVIAESRRALNLKEASYPVVRYIPREDVASTYLVRSTHQTRCPYKGDASYYSIVVDGNVSKDAVWSYENPLSDLAAISKYMAFYPSRVDRIEETP